MVQINTSDLQLSKTAMTSQALRAVMQRNEHALAIIIKHYAPDYLDATPQSEQTTEGMTQYAVVRFRIEDDVEESMTKSMAQLSGGLRDATAGLERLGRETEKAAFAFRSFGSALLEQKHMGIIGNCISALALVLLPAVAAAQTKAVTVYTNVVDGQRQRAIVSEVRQVTIRTMPIPDSIQTTLTLDIALWKQSRLGPTSYIPAQRATPPSIPTPKPAPLFINGINVGPSPSGEWTSITTAGIPTVNVRLVGGNSRLHRMSWPIVSPWLPPNTERSAATRADVAVRNAERRGLTTSAPIGMGAASGHEPKR